MEASFWHDKWQNNDIAFHEGAPHPLLTHYFDTLNLPTGSRVFLPLCGKTLDIGWLLGKGYQVVGAELSDIAITQLFSDLGIEPEIAILNNHKHYYAENIDIYVGDVFDLSADIVGRIDAVYDRAALVALPDGLRERYTEQLMAVANKAPQLLITFAYDQTVLAGPPFSVTKTMIDGYYGEHYNVTLLEQVDVVGGLKGKCSATENVWLLQCEV